MMSFVTANQDSAVSNIPVAQRDELHRTIWKIAEEIRAQVVERRVIS